MASDLVAVPKEIDRAGKTFVQRYWMKVDAVADLIKQQGYDGAAKQLGANPQVVRSLSQAWAGSSTSDESIRTMAGVAKLVGYAQKTAPVRSTKMHADTFDEQFEKEDSEQEKALIAIHALTQAGLRHEPDVVKVMRGVGGKFATQIRDHAISLAEAGVPIEEAVLHVDFNPLNSFSQSSKVANKFGAGAVVFNIEVPKSSILLSHHNSPGLSGHYKHEMEYAVMSAGPTPVKIGDLGGEHGTAIKAAFKANLDKVAGYKALVAAGVIEPGTALPLTMDKKQVSTGGPEKVVPVSLYIPHPAGIGAGAVEAHLKESGASSAVSNAGATVQSDKIDEFTKKFAATPVFDKSKEGGAAALAKHMKNKAAALQVAPGLTNKIDPAAVQEKLKELKGSKVAAFINMKRKGGKQEEPTGKAPPPGKNEKPAPPPNLPKPLGAAKVEHVTMEDSAKAAMQLVLASPESYPHPAQMHLELKHQHELASKGSATTLENKGAHKAAALLHGDAYSKLFQKEITSAMKEQSEQALRATHAILGNKKPSKPSAATAMKAVQPPATSMAGKDITSISAAPDWETHPHKAAALKALGYQPNKKGLSPEEEKVVNTALKGFDIAKAAGVLKGDHADHVMKMTKALAETHGVKGSTKWADADAAADKLMSSLANDPEPTKHTEASAKVAKELEGEKAPYRSFWPSFAKQGVKKGTPEGKVVAAFEKAQADTKVLMAKAHLQKQKLSNYAIYSLLKKQMAKHL